MKKSVLFVCALPTLFLAGCSTSGGTADALTKFGKIVSDVMPFVNETEEWEAYADNIVKQGLVYGSASTADMKFVSNKMDAEYASAVNRFASPFARNAKDQGDLAKANQGYLFKYNQVQVVKDKKTSNTIGYCVNYDRLENGLGKDTKAEDKLYKEFIYIAKDKPVSIATITSDFTKKVCGESFYNKYKN